uniref:Uncharacterized protein n=1 Tax=Romanomermis culicivorax TaxID=13658 RepID=A0A915KQC2_ROMCU
MIQTPADNSDGQHRPTSSTIGSQTEPLSRRLQLRRGVNRILADFGDILSFFRRLRPSQSTERCVQSDRPSHSINFKMQGLTADGYQQQTRSIYLRNGLGQYSHKFPFLYDKLAEATNSIQQNIATTATVNQILGLVQDKTQESDEAELKIKW